MPDAQPAQKQQIQPFDSVIEQQAEQFLKDMDALKVGMLDRAARKEWAKDKLKKEFPLQIIEQSLKANNYDFDAVGKYLDNIWKSKTEAEQALKEVRDMKEKEETEKKQLKKATHLSWIVAALMTSGIGAGMSVFLKKETGELELGGAGTEMASSMLSKFISGGWVIAIAAGVVGMLLAVFALAEHFKEKEKLKKQQQAEVAKVEASMQQQMPASQPAKLQ